jgi:hypothetical protein
MLGFTSSVEISCSQNEMLFWSENYWQLFSETDVLFTHTKFICWDMLFPALFSMNWVLNMSIEIIQYPFFMRKMYLWLVPHPTLFITHGSMESIYVCNLHGTHLSLCSNSLIFQNCACWRTGLVVSPVMLTKIYEIKTCTFLLHLSRRAASNSGYKNVETYNLLHKNGGSCSKTLIRLYQTV